LLEAARLRLESSITAGATYKEMKAAMVEDQASVYPGAGLFLVPWKCDSENEEKIKEECKATLRCYPFAENEAGMANGKKCFYSGEDATHMALFGRAF
jgi:prolyl-tRNA synthetase